MYNALPLHYQITQELRKNIKKGYWKAGDLFPTDKQLMEKYNVSSTTVRRAIYELVKEGWLERKPGKGTFVKKEMVETLKKLTGFFEEIEAKGMKPSAQLLKIEEVKLNDILLEEVPELKDFEKDSLIKIRKIQKMNDYPVAYLESYWSLEIGKELQKHDLTSQGMYQILQNSLGITLEKADQVISASISSEKVAKALNIEVGAPILVMRRTVFSGDEILEVSINQYRADMYSYRVKLDSSVATDNNGMIIEKPNI